MNQTHTVQWLTEMRVPVAPDLSQYLVEIQTPEHGYVGMRYVPVGTTATSWSLPPGSYVEKVSATNAAGTVWEGTIERPFTVGDPAPPIDPPPTGEPAPFPFPVWGDPFVPPVLAPGAVDKAQWEINMEEYGRRHGEYLLTHPDDTPDQKLGFVYYDMARVMYQIADYTGEPEPWNTYAKEAMRWFRDTYIIPNAGGVPGYYNFTHGLRMDYERTGDALSKEWAITLSSTASFASDATDRTYIVSHGTSREIAYAILGFINAEALGEPKRDIRAEWVDVSHTYFAQWYDTAHWGTDQISPFMAAITAQALIADWEETQDARCLPALVELGEWMWTEAYHAPTQAMRYQLNPISPEGYVEEGAPDLNLIIAPVYGWLWQQTGETVHRDRFDALLYGSRNAWLEGGKQFDQNYWWSFSGMRWRETTPA